MLRVEQSVPEHQNGPGAEARPRRPHAVLHRANPQFHLLETTTRPSLASPIESVSLLRRKAPWERLLLLLSIRYVCSSNALLSLSCAPPICTLPGAIRKLRTPLGLPPVLSVTWNLLSSSARNISTATSFEDTLLSSFNCQLWSKGKSLAPKTTFCGSGITV